MIWVASEAHFWHTTERGCPSQISLMDLMGGFDLSYKHYGEWDPDPDPLDFWIELVTNFLMKQDFAGKYWFIEPKMFCRNVLGLMNVWWTTSRFLPWWAAEDSRLPESGAPGQPCHRCYDNANNNNHIQWWTAVKLTRIMSVSVSSCQEMCLLLETSHVSVS